MKNHNNSTLSSPPVLDGCDLPPWVRDLASSPPAPGEGKLDGWLFCVARGMAPYRNDANIIALLATLAPSRGRDVPRIVANARRHAWQPDTSPPYPDRVSATPPRWPLPDLAGIDAIVSDGPRAVDLAVLSPVLRDEDDGALCLPCVEALFADAATPDPLLCVGRSAQRFATRPLSFWRSSGRLADMSLIVPAQMAGRWGVTRDGKRSEHTLDNTGSRRFAVVEFDFALHDKAGKPTLYAPLIDRWVATSPPGWDDRDAVRDACSALLWYLDDFLPLVLVVHSGGKSLHGWFHIAGQQPANVLRFEREAARLGADATLFRNHSQFVRLPAGTRDSGCRQSVFYFAPGLLSDLTDVQSDTTTAEGRSNG